MSGQKEKVIVVGVDGATFDIINRIKDTLPNISKMMDKGSYGKLRSTIPMISATAWTTFSTGKNPGKHGIYDFVNKVPGEYRFQITSARDRKSKPLWVLLSEAGRNVSVIGCTLTYPPDVVNGYMISGLGTPNKKGFPVTSEYAYPKDLISEIEKEVGRFQITPDVNIKNISDGLKKEINELVDYKIRLNEYFFRNHLNDFNLYFFGETDLASHFFWNDKEFIHGIYRKIDGFVGRLLEKDDVNIILMSDHGFASKDRMIFIDRWLEHEGLLKSKKRSSFSRLNKIIHRENNDSSLADIVWEETKAFSGRSSSGSIFINLKGREPNGCVEPADYERTLAEITSKLINLKDPKTGEKIVERVHQKKDIFKGEAISSAPDLVAEFKKGCGVGMKSIEDRNLKDGFITDSVFWLGDHEMNGVFMAYGPAFNEGTNIEGAEITDVAPTIIYLYGLSVHQDMDGKVLSKAIKKSFIELNPMRLSTDSTISAGDNSVLSKEEEDLIADSLRELGYLE